MGRPANDQLKVPSGAAVYIGRPRPSAPAPSPGPQPETLTLSATGAATAGVEFSVTLTATNLTAALLSVPERVSGPGLTFTPVSVNPAPGELVKLFGVVADSAGTARLRAVGGSVVSNELAYTVNAAPGPAPYPNIVLGYDGANPEHICLRCPITGTVPEGTLVRVEHKLSGAATWRQGPFLSRVRLADLGTLPTAVVGNVGDSFVGMAFGVATAIAASTVLDVRLCIYPPGGGTQYVTGTHTLRALAAPAPGITHTCTPATFAAVLASLPHQSGTDVHLRMGAGTYTWSALAWTKGGTSGKPIYVSAAALGDVVINTASGQALLPQASFVVFERLRFNGSGTDSGTASTSEWLAIPGGAPEYTDWSVRDCEVLGFDRGAVSYMPVRNFDFRRVKMVGNNLWAASFLPNGFGATGNNATWNDHGICLPGVGNSATQCEIKGHGDAWRTYASSSYKQFTAGCGMTRCDIRNSGDDFAEFDGTSGNSYAFECRGVNVGNGVSADDTYGPAFVVKCLLVNASRGPLKLTSNSYGTRLANCTFVLTVKGPADHGMLTPSGGTQDGFELVNCATHYAGAGNALYWSSSLLRDTWANNAWFPDRGFFINTVGTYANLAAAKIGNAARFANDVLLGSQPFVVAITLGANCATEYTGSPTGEIASGNAARAAGAAIAGITDGYSGAAPDIGCVIAGQPLVQYGVPVVTLPSWIPVAGEVSTLTQANGRLGNSFVSQCAPYYSAYQSATIVEAYSTTVLNPYWGALGAIMAFGGGHAATNNNAVYVVPVSEVLTWKRITNPSPIYGSGSDTDTQGRNTGYTSGDGELTGSFGPGTHLVGTTCAYAIDGQPAAPHSYSTLDVVPPSPGRPAGTLILPALAAASFYQPASNYSVSAYELPMPDASGTIGTYAWSLRKTHDTYPSSGQSGSSVLTAPVWAIYEPGYDRQQYMSRVAQPPRWFDRTINNYVAGTGAGVPHTDVAGTGDTGSWFRVPERGINVWMYKDSTTGNLKARVQVESAQPAWSSSVVTFSTALALPNGWSAACWCADNSRIIVGGVTGDTTGVYEITIPTNLADPWTVVRAAFGASQVINWGANNVYKKWTYNPAIKAILYPERIGNGDTTTDIWRCYKPRNV